MAEAAPLIDYEGAAAEHGVAPAPAATGTAPPQPVRRGPFPLDLPILKYLNSKRVILASASPRRKALLAQVGLVNLEILPSTKPENLDKSTHTPDAYVAATARQKCLDVYEIAVTAASKAAEAGDTTNPAIREPDVVISADTVVVTCDGQILEKPRSEADHLRMLRQLRNVRRHRVLTAVCAIAPRVDARSPGYKIETHVESTDVVFASEEGGLSDQVIEAYVKTREGADKAGGYAVQGIGGLILVEKVEGSVDNVVGLPVRRCLELAEQVVFDQDNEDAEDDEEGEEE